MAALAATTLSAAAQSLPGKATVKKIVSVQFDKNSGDALTRIDSNQMPIHNMYYFRPRGFFYSGWNKEFICPHATFAPANMDLTFKAYHSGGIPQWTYPSGEFDNNGKPLNKTEIAESITFNLPEGTYDTPVLVDPDEPVYDLYSPGIDMRIGGSTGKEDLDFAGFPMCYDAYAVNYVPAGYLADFGSYICTANPTASDDFTYILNCDTYNTYGFGELFESPAPMSLRGFNALVVAENGFEDRLDEVDFSFKKYVDGEYVDIVTDDKFDVEVSYFSDIMDGYRYYHLLCTIKDGPIEIPGDTYLIPMIHSNSVQVGPMFDGQPKYDKNVDKMQHVTTMFVDADVDGGRGMYQFKGMSATNEDNLVLTITSWCFGLDMSYAADQITGINDVTGREQTGDGKVYDLKGIMVSENGSTGNLPSGLYIKDGKKIIVK